MADLETVPTATECGLRSRTARAMHLIEDERYAPAVENSRMPVPDPIAGFTRASEKAALRATFAPLAALEADQRDTDEKTIDARAKGETSKSSDLANRAEVLKVDHAKVRGMARVGILGAADAAATRAAAEYVAACHMVADAAARYVALASMRDDLLSGARRTFDPLGLWSLTGGLLAPELAHRPRGWCTVSDVFGREYVWHPTSPAHADAVRRHQEAFKAEMQSLSGGARWPF